MESVTNGPGFVRLTVMDARPESAPAISRAAS
jgi:hypothetical protein